MPKVTVTSVGGKVDTLDLNDLQAQEATQALNTQQGNHTIRLSDTENLSMNMRNVYTIRVVADPTPEPEPEPTPEPEPEAPPTEPTPEEPAPTEPDSEVAQLRQQVADLTQKLASAQADDDSDAQQIAQLTTERDTLKARVEQLENTPAVTVNDPSKPTVLENVNIRGGTPPTEPVTSDPAGTPLAEDFPGAHLLADAGYTTREQVAALTDDELDTVKGIGPATIAQIKAALSDKPE